ncbi:uncharacterized protein FA14DRAFT_175658 [Meira miltonrushii]|uniref:AMP-dependent synthetase/ligase domain-containing protein n=1 Tax=Meira miltonrushii TaxID=1280837 RepID=A0A316V173_9BASI|nr:uncharacterized protein FA14DRAFT_175658 [Meira miltonrushii]PWN31307.1 hypothetical protein FA14DRAFT_175658 [Meira miltonrushii]
MCELKNFKNLVLFVCGEGRVLSSKHEIRLCFQPTTIIIHSIITMAAKELSAQEGKQTFSNDVFQVDSPCLENFLEGISFWSKHTPTSPALLFPRTPASKSMETVQWNEFRDSVQLAKEWLCKTLSLPSNASKIDVSGLNEDEARDKRTITLLIAPTHDNICILMALASMGYTTQFICLAHVYEVIATLIHKAQSQKIITGGLDQDRLEKSQSHLKEISNSSSHKWFQTEEKSTLSGFLDRVRVFGSTNVPKLYPVSLESANLSATDSAKFWCALPNEKRWRRQLETSLCFHFSFQQPVWRALMCGTALIFPVIRANQDQSTHSHERKGGKVLIPNATDILDSLAMADGDALYASPTGLERMTLTGLQTENESWKRALSSLKDAHTGGAPASRQMADTFAKANLEVMQVFATTEAGMLFLAKPSLTKHLCNLTPRPQLAHKMLFYQRDPKDDTLELWLPEDFPGLQKYGLKFEAYPGDESIQAWNTCDTFARLTPYAPLYEFRGRTDDWLRLTVGTACRALEIEDRLMELMREPISQSSSKEQSPVLSPSGSSSSQFSTTDLQNSFTSDSSDAQRVEAVTVLGHARKALSAVVQLKDCTYPQEEEKQMAKRAAEIITEEKLQYPLILRPEAIIFATPETPAISITQKGSVQRKKNEQAFGSILDKMDL